MTTITLVAPTERCPRYQVFGNYEGPDDRYTFGLREFVALDDARRYADRLRGLHAADHLYSSAR